MASIVSQLRHDFPDIQFIEGKHYHWSPHSHTITYQLDEQTSGVWSLLHEVGHALLGHARYDSDMDLLSKEVSAWQTANDLAERYGTQVDELYVQDCLDSYRNWLHRRSTCPRCQASGLQSAQQTYYCINCSAGWRVTDARFCRPYRRTLVVVDHKTI